MDKSNGKEDDKSPLINKISMEDPYFSVRDSVRGQSEKIKVKYSRFQEAVRNLDTASSPDFKELRKGLSKDVRAFEKDLKFLVESVEAVEKDRKKFIMIKDADLASRQKFVADMQSFIADVKKGLESQSVRQKMDDDANRVKRNAGSNPDANPAMSRNAELDRENDRFVKDQKLRTKEIIADQDKNLVVLGESVDRLGQTSRAINSELKEQQVLLDGLETDIDTASGRLGVVMEGLQKLLKTKDGCQIWIIVILAIILILLIALVIWT